jgi:hypothetical protein
LPASSQPSLERAELEYLIHHIFLPPKLPQKSDSAIKMDGTLTKQVLEALRQFKAIGDERVAANVDKCIFFMQKMLQCKGPNGFLLAASVEAQMGEMEHDGEFKHCTEEGGVSVSLIV